MDTPQPNAPAPILPQGYEDFLGGLKKRIQNAQIKAVLAVNSELVMLYWRIGRDILERQAKAGWGAKVIDRLAKDLHQAFPEMKGFSRSNLLYMRSFATAWPDVSIVQQAAGQLPWLMTSFDILMISQLLVSFYAKTRIASLPNTLSETHRRR